MEAFLSQVDALVLAEEAAGGSAPPPLPPPPEEKPGSNVTPDVSAEWLECYDCCTKTVASSRSTVENICPKCGRIFEKPCDEESAILGLGPSRPPDIRPTPRLRIVGTDAHRLQRLVDSASVADSDETCISDLCIELFNYNREYQDRTGRSFSKVLLREVATKYVKEVRPAAGVIRSQKKQAVLAVLVHQMCSIDGQARNRAEAANLLQLTGRGLARGESRLRLVGACINELEIDQDAAWIETTFAKTGLIYKAHELQACGFSHDETAVRITAEDEVLIQKLKLAANELLQRGIKLHIGVEFVPQTRATGIVHAVLRRAALAGILPPHWNLPAEPLPRTRGTVEWIAGLCEIRPQTVRGYLNELYRYHSKLIAVLRKHRLHAKRVEHL